METEKLKGKIDEFLKFFRDLFNTVKDAEFNKPNELIRKLFYVGLIDTLSRTACNPKKGNRNRILTIVKHFCDWPNQDKISLPHLVILLEKVPYPEFSNLREHAYSLLNNWREGEIVTLDKDPDFTDINNLWPRDIPKPLHNIQIEFLQHAYLFYWYRNSLIHELREPGYGMDFIGGKKEPYYHSRTNSDADPPKKTWELVYPIGFYETICEKAINNLEKYYLKERIDPYSCYTFGTYWIDELNK